VVVDTEKIVQVVQVVLVALVVAVQEQLQMAVEVETALQILDLVVAVEESILVKVAMVDQE